MRRSTAPVLGALAVSILCGLLLGCDDDGTGPPAPEVHIVTVAGDALPLQITPDPVLVNRLDTIKWLHSEADTLKIDLSELGIAIVLIAPAGDTAEVLVPPSTPFGDYKYSVTVKFGADSVFVDPRVIVEEG